MGSGICGNQMCWQLRGKWQRGVGDLGWGLVPFRPPGLPLPHPTTPSPTEPRFSLSASALFSFAFRALYLILGREWKERRGLSLSLPFLLLSPPGASLSSSWFLCPHPPVFPSVFSCLSSSP